MSQSPATHIAFADETNYNRGSYPGIALVSLARVEAGRMKAELAHLLTSCAVPEFKWEKLHSAKRRFAAMRLIEYTIEQALAGALRVDVLTWDLGDGRHRVPKPDRIANLQRMYFHLFHNVLRLRWPDEVVWQLRPDEHSALAWQEIHQYLEQHNTAVSAEATRLPITGADLSYRKTFHIKDIVPCQSDHEPLVQLADLFVGMGSYSRAHYAQYPVWQQGHKTGQLSLLGREGDLSHRDRERWQVIDALYQQCKLKKLGVSLSSQAGLRTHNPQFPINFWWYVPQHQADKAPSRP